MTEIGRKARIAETPTDDPRGADCSHFTTCGWQSMTKIVYSRECPECGGETYQFERCHLCGDIPWKGENA